jgi:hypothetical protein
MNILDNATAFKTTEVKPKSDTCATDELCPHFRADLVPERARNLPRTFRELLVVVVEAPMQPVNVLIRITSVIRFGIVVGASI